MHWRTAHREQENVWRVVRSGQDHAFLAVGGGERMHKLLQLRLQVQQIPIIYWKDKQNHKKAKEQKYWNAGGINLRTFLLEWGFFNGLESDWKYWRIQKQWRKLQIIEEGWRQLPRRAAKVLRQEEETVPCVKGKVRENSPGNSENRWKFLIFVTLEVKTL